MSESARVTATDAVAAFEAAVVRFGEEAEAALLSIDRQIGRAIEWLDHEAPARWRRETRRAFDEVARTRGAWENCRLRTATGERPSCVEEEKAHRAAKRRLDVARDKPEQVRRWAIEVRREVDEYRARIGRLRRCLEGNAPRTAALLGRTRPALDAYVDRREMPVAPGQSPGRDPETPGREYGGAGADR